MAMPVRKIREWLDSLRDDQEVGVDEGGLCLEVVDAPEEYLEVGGLPEDEEEDD
jgi:hypothetical protein